MTDQSRDRLEGKFDELKGRAKEAAAEQTGDEETQREGQVDQAVGKGKQGMADVKDKADEAVKNLTDRQDR